MAASEAGWRWIELDDYSAEFFSAYYARDLIHCCGFHNKAEDRISIPKKFKPKATMEYHKTRDILHVKEILGHKSLNNTMLYTQLVNFNPDDFTSAVAHSEEETCKLIENGFEYVCDFGQNKIFRKRK